MAILNSVVGGLVRGSLIVGGAAVRGGVRVAYGLGEAGAHGIEVGQVEWDRQTLLTQTTVDNCKAQSVAARAAFEAAKLARLAAPAQAAPVMVAAPSGKAAKA